MVEIAITRIPAFIFGCIMGKYVYEKRTISILWIIPIVVLPVFFFAVLHVDVLHDCIRRLFFIVGGVPLTFGLAELFKFIDWVCSSKAGYNSFLIKFFTLAGGASLELYYTHVLAWHIYRMTLQPYYKTMTAWIILLIIAFAAAIIVNKFEKKMKWI